jgi:hypothetical protein
VTACVCACVCLSQQHPRHPLLTHQLTWPSIHHPPCLQAAAATKGRRPVEPFVPAKKPESTRSAAGLVQVFENVTN